MANFGESSVVGDMMDTQVEASEERESVVRYQEPVSGLIRRCRQPDIDA